jgi:hypothetical protein
MAASNGGIFNTIIGTVCAGIVAWGGKITGMTYNNKESIARLDERTLIMEVSLGEVKVTLRGQDGKLDRLVEHILKEK